MVETSTSDPRDQPDLVQGETQKQKTKQNQVEELHMHWSTKLLSINPTEM